MSVHFVPLTHVNDGLLNRYCLWCLLCLDKSGCRQGSQPGDNCKVEMEDHFC